MCGLHRLCARARGRLARPLNRRGAGVDPPDCSQVTRMSCVYRLTWSSIPVEANYVAALTAAESSSRPLPLPAQKRTFVRPLLPTEYFGRPGLDSSSACYSKPGGTSSRTDQPFFATTFVFLTAFFVARFLTLADLPVPSIRALN